MKPDDRTFRGIWCASVTPLHPDLSIDIGRLETHLLRLFGEGCDGIALFGSTGEGNSFTVAERADCVRRLADRGLPMARILVGAGACAVPDALALADVARDAAAAGLMMHPPFYYRAVSDDGLFAFMERFVAGLGERPVRVILYHFPGLVGVGYSEELIARLYAFRPDVFAGLKDSSGDVDRMAAIAQANPGFSVLAGNERLLLGLLQRGGAGCLTATTNLTAPLARKVYIDRDPVDQERLTARRRALETAPFIPGLKRLLADRDGDPGWLAVRPPLEPAPQDVVDALRAAVTDTSA